MCDKTLPKPEFKSPLKLGTGEYLLFTYSKIVVK